MGTDFYLHHVVLTSGRSHRAERGVEAEARIRICANLLAEALAGGKPVVPGIVPAVSMSATDGERCLTVSLSRTDIPFSSPVLTFGVAERARCGAALWRALHDAAAPHEFATHCQPWPPEPWCAEHYDSTRPLYVDGNAWTSLAELERCIAWAFLDRLAQGQMG